jgi:glycerophosphoryl diester phosphodiesterase
VATYADGIGANMNLIVPRDSGNNVLEPTSLIDDAHEAGLIVDAWTFRAENSFMPEDFRLGDPAAPDYLTQYGDLESEIQLFLELGLDGIFTDQPDIGVAARYALTSQQ